MKKRGYINIRKFRLSTKHLFIILILGIIFTSALVMRSYPLKYGFYLHEYDPYFNYRATQYIVDHGLDAYWNWHDVSSWYPEGRDIANTSQSGLHVVAATLFGIFGQGISLLSFVIVFPMVISSLTTVIFFFFIKLVTNRTSSGLFAALLFAVSPPLVIRGSLGWFKSEPLGLFLGFSSLCLFILSIKETRATYIIPAALMGGVSLGLGNASWNGVQFFAIPISIFLFILPFYRNNNTKLKYSVILFTVFAIITAATFPRSGITSIFNLPNIALAGGAMFFVISDILKSYTVFGKKEKRNVFFLLIVFIGISLTIVTSGVYYIADVKYLAAINPFFDPPVFFESVAEHTRSSPIEYILYFSTLFILSLVGSYFILKCREKLLIFALIIGISGFYISTTVTRLLVFASIAIITLSSIGIQRMLMFSHEDKKIQTFTEHSSKQKSKEVSLRKPSEKEFKLQTKIARLSIFAIIFILLFLPMVYPQGLTWIDLADVPPPIINGNTGQPIKITDWLDALEWISKNTPENSVYASWWDHGYWITTLGNRTTLADNAANNQTRVETIAKMFMENPTVGLHIAHSLKADYILVYTVARNITINGEQYYILGNGGDESTIYTISQLSRYPTGKFLEADEFTPKQLFWNSTLLGQLMPYVPKGYIFLDDYYDKEQSKFLTDDMEIFESYKPGSFAIYSIKDIKSMEKTDNSKTNLSLAYYSNSILNANDITAIIIYKITSD